MLGMRLKIFTRARLARFLVPVFLMVTATSAEAVLLYTSTASVDDTNGNVTIGFGFTPSVDIIVSALGVFDDGADGVRIQDPNGREVGLWTPGGSLLRSATITNNSGIDSGFRFESVTPVTLSASTQYVLGVFYASGLIGDKATGGIQTPASGITLGSTVSSVATGVFTFPSDPRSTFITTANLAFEPAPVTDPPGGGTAMPEPPAVIGFALVVAGLVFTRRRRRTP